MNRRKFISITALASVGMLIFNACKNGVLKMLFTVTGTKHILGHRLWTKDFPQSSSQENYKIVVIGGGISGLTAIRELEKRGISNIALYELEDYLGGNSHSKSNKHASYPTGAHYVPSINLNFPELQNFFLEEGIITSIKDGKAIYQPEYVCHDPEERLFMNYNWIEGIEPHLNSEEFESQMQQFVIKMEAYRNLKDSKGKYVFDLPIAYSSQEEEFLKLDSISLFDWLKEQQFTNSNLIWFIDYCCLDDYGRSSKHVSAWAGIHYFTCRKHHEYSFESEILTWPEGNDFLAKRLRKNIKASIFKNHIAFDLKLTNNGVQLHVYDQENNQTKTITAEKVILATPQYVNKYLINRPEIDDTKFQHAPWIVATITLDRFSSNSGASLSWENIIFEGKGLGYVYNQHQLLNQVQTPFVITYYRALDATSLKKSRRDLMQKTDDYWKQEIINDLKKAHPDIENHILEIELFKRGHGMISPEIDFLHSQQLKSAGQPIDQKIYFAHTDYSGISLFEEAFYQGVKVANEIIAHEI